MVLAYGHRGICIRSSTLGIISQLLVHIDFPKYYKLIVKWVKERQSA